MSLFKGQSLADLLEAKLVGLAAQIGQLPASQVNDPRLAGMIEDLWKKNRPDIPMIFRDQKTGSKREQHRSVTDYGRQVDITETVVDVQVPFKGDHRMLHIRLSSSALLDARFSVAQNYIQYTMPLDPAQEGNYDKMLQAIEDTLANTRREEEAFARHAIDRLYQLALQRKKQLDEEAAKAKAFSFPVT